EGGVDARADQYALAVTLYEMLAGTPPFTGATAAAIIATRYSRPTPSVRAVRPEIPESIDAALQRALAVEPGDRFESVAAFAHALESETAGLAPPTTPAVRPRRALLFAFAVAAVLGTAGVVLWRGTHTVAATGEPVPVKVLAVLPFDNLGDSSDVYFADG